MSSHQTRLSILATLVKCGPHKLPESALKHTIQQMTVEDITNAEIGIEINWLHAKGWIDFVKDPMGDPDPRWFITPEGKEKVR